MEATKMANPKDAAKEAADTGKLMLKEEVRLEFIKVLREILFGKSKWIDEAVGGFYRQFFKECYPDYVKALDAILHPNVLSNVDQECLDFIAIESAHLSGVNFDNPNLVLKKENFQNFCDGLKTMIDEATDENGYVNIAKAHEWLQGRRWIGKGFFVKRLAQNAKAILSIESISENLKKVAAWPIWRTVLNAMQDPSEDLVEFMIKAVNQVTDFLGNKPTNVQVDKENPLNNIFNSTILFLKLFTNYLFVGFGWLKKQGQRDWHKIRWTAFWIIIGFALLALADIALIYAGLRIGYFSNLGWGIFLLILAIFLLSLLMIALKAILWAIAATIYTIKLADAFALHPFVWLLKNGGKFAWEVSTVPIKFSFDAVTDVLKAALMLFGIDVKSIATLSGDTSYLSGAEGEAWDKAKKRSEEIKKALLAVNSAITIIFKYSVAFILACIFIILTKWHTSGEGSSLFLHDYLFALLSGFLLLTFFIDKGIKEFRARIAGIKGESLEKYKHSFRTSTLTALTCLIIVIGLNWSLDSYLDGFYYGNQAVAAAQRLENIGVDNRRKIYDDLSQQRIINGPAEFYCAIQVKDSFKLIIDDTLKLPASSGEVAVQERVHFDGEIQDKFGRFIIFRRYNANHLLLPDDYYAVLGRYVRALSQKDIYQPVTIEYIPSMVPNYFTYNAHYGEQVEFGYVNPGDVLTIDLIEVNEPIKWRSDKNSGDNIELLQGVGYTPLSRHLDHAERFMAPHLPVAAFLINVPGYGTDNGWEVLDQPKSYRFKHSGKCYFSINAQKRYFPFCKGVIDVYMTFTPAAAVANPVKVDSSDSLEESE